MKRCRHPATALRWNRNDGVFVCQKCGQIIFPPSPAADDDHDDCAGWDAALCLLCGGRGDISGAPCATCQGEGYVPEVL